MGDSDRSSSRGARVYVGGLDDNIKKEDLEGEFEKFGKLNNVWIALNPPGFAFIEFSSLSDAENACDNLNGIDFLGSKLRVEIAKERRGGGFRGGRGRGGSRGGGFRDDRGFRGGRFDGGRRGGGSSFRGGRRDDYSSSSSSSRFGGRDFGRRSDSYSGGGGGGGGRGSGGPPRRFEGGSNYRSRSPMGGPRR